MRRSRSEAFFSQAQLYIPGGVNSPVRSFRSVGGSPPFISHGRGGHIWDVDGNSYVDFLCSWGPLILGHAHPTVIETIRTTLESGTSFGSPVPQEVVLAQAICDAFPSIDMVRLVNSGTEACMSAIRLARAYTNRTKIVKFSGCYHGHAAGLLVKTGSGALALGVPNSAGVPQGYADETLLADYNDLASVRKVFEAYPDQVAGVIVEPVAGNMGVVPPAPGFLEELSQLSAANGALLILDEVITGFRVAYGGAQSLYNVVADITCLGKIIGGGLPVGAYGGRREIMEMVAPLGPMYQAGTLSGNPISVNAGVATLKALREPGTYEQLESLTAQLTAALSDAAGEAGVPLTINRVGSMFTSFFNPGPVRNLAEVEASDSGKYARFFHGMLDRGIYLAPSQYEASFLSLAHTNTDLERTQVAAGEVLRELT